MSTERTRTRAANQARQQATETKLDRLREILRTMQRDRVPVTYPAVARRSGVSRSFLYQNSDAKTLMTAAVAASGSSVKLTPSMTPRCRRRGSNDPSTPRTR